MTAERARCQNAKPFLGVFQAMAEQFELKVPSVGESITEVQIGKWHKSVGQQVEKDENVVELESDKATVDLPAPAAGTISKMLKQSGQTAAVGEVIDDLGAVAEGIPVVRIALVQLLVGGYGPGNVAHVAGAGRCVGAGEHAR